MKKLVLAILIALLAAAPASAYPASRETTAGMKWLDGLVVRPLTFLMAVPVGLAVFAAVLPVAGPTGTAWYIAPYLLEAPMRFTAGRHLGEWDNYLDDGTIVGSTRMTPREERADLEKRMTRLARGES